MPEDVTSNSQASGNSIKMASSGIKWSSISYAARQGTQFLTTLILAQILSPDDFGLISMTFVVIGFINIFKDLGTSAAIIQRETVSDELVSSVFWINILFGGFASIILFLLAGPISLFYEEPRIFSFIQVLSISFFIASFGIMHQTLLQRKLDFFRLAIVEITAVLLASSLGIGAAFSGWGAWSLVVQSVTVVTVTSIMLWFFSEWRPALQLDWMEVYSVSSYSLNLTGFSIFNYFARNMDYILIGKFLGSEALGFYTIAYQLVLYPVQIIGVIMNRVTFPIYAKLQKDLAEFRSFYLSVTSLIAFLSFPFMLSLVPLAEPFIIGFLGEKWEQSIVIIQILALVGVFQSVATISGGIYQAMGRTGLMFVWGLISGILRTVAFVVGLRWGIWGVAVGYAISTLILALPGLYLPFSLIDLTLRRYFYGLIELFLFALVVLGVMWGVTQFLSAATDMNSPRIEFLIVGFAGTTVYLLIIFFFGKTYISQLREILNLGQ